MELAIRLPWPPSVNGYWRNVKGKTLISADGRLYRNTVIKLCLGINTRFEGKIQVFIAASPPDKRRRDLDNMLKAPLDAMQHAGIYDDDSQIDDLHIWRSNVVPYGELGITISEMRVGSYGEK